MWSGSNGCIPNLPRYIMGGTILAPVGLLATETSAVLVHPESSKQQASKHESMLIPTFASVLMRSLKLNLQYKL